MDFEERINKLTERHEALTQSVEMLHTDIREMQRTMREGFEKHDEQIGKMLRIAELQHERITRLEDGR